MHARARVSDKRAEMRDRKRKIRNKMECDTESRDLLENHTAGPLFTFRRRRRRWRSKALPANAGWQISEPPPSPGFPSAGPAVIFLMISLFCRKSLSLGETRHFRPGET